MNLGNGNKLWNFTCDDLQKQSSRGVFFNKVAGPGLQKKEPWKRCFPVNFVKFIRTPLLQNTSG